MYKNILLATDGSELGAKAVSHGLALAKLVGARVVVLTVTAPWSNLDMAEAARRGLPDPAGQFDAIAAASARQILDGAAQQAKELDVSCDLVHVRNRYPAEGIISTVNDKNCDLIVMGSRGLRGISRILLGSQTYEVLAHCRVPALIVH